MRLTTAEIDRYGPLYDCRPVCGDGITVLSGPNEAGKTLYLEALLQLLEPDIVDVMSPGPRVSQAPTGRVMVEFGEEEFECDGENSLGDISEIEPSHLDSVFVVRDSDLQLPDDQGYYTSLIEKLGDIHTTEINAIKSALKDRGRLTDRRLNISSDRGYNNAGTVRDEAQALAGEVRAYADHIEDESLGEFTARRLRIKRQLRQSRTDLEIQRDAQRVAGYERLSDQLETYREKSEELAELEPFDRDELGELRELSNSLDRDQDQMEELESDIESKEAEVDQIASSLESHREQLAELEQRESTVDDARSALETFRDRQDDASGVERRLSITKAVTIAGVLAAGAAGGLGALVGSAPAIGLGVVILLIAIVSGLAYHHVDNQLSSIETARASVLQAARDAGFDVEKVEAVAPSIESFDNQLAQARDRVTRTDQQLTDAEESLDDLRAEHSELEEQIRNQDAELENRLEAAGVEALEEFKARVERREELTPEQQSARQSLIDRFREPDDEEPLEKAESWADSLQGLIDDIDQSLVTADTYDEAELERLNDQIEELESNLEELQTKLEDHDDRLDQIDRDARGLNTEPFIGRGLSLDARTPDGLRSLARNLDEVVQQLEKDAELSRKALGIFETIEDQEEEKLTDLFDPDGPASKTFERLTGGRYSTVAYDADPHDLIVERQDGRTFGPKVLSQGTSDQLYFATRVSLAQQLLGNEPGLFLLDDPFVAADPDRLREGFETLHDLAANGWQILYMTSKQEVSETMVNEYGLDRVELDAVPLNENPD